MEVWFDTGRWVVLTESEDRLCRVYHSSELILENVQDVLHFLFDCNFSAHRLSDDGPNKPLLFQSVLHGGHVVYVRYHESMSHSTEAAT